MKRLYPKIEFIQMDVTKMTFEDNSFDIVLDKACLDAILCNDSDEILDSVTKMMNEIKRVLKPKGKYICVSLLQVYVLNKLLIEYNSWNIDFSIISVSIGESSLCPFFLIFEQSDKPIINLHFQSQDGFLRLNDGIDNSSFSKKYENNISIISPIITETQYYYNQRHKLEVINNDFVYETDIFLYNESKPRYHLSIYDNNKSNYDEKELSKVGVFIIPQGKENQWIYKSNEGRNKIVYQSKYNRIIFVCINRNHHYNSLDEVQNELNPLIPQYYPIKYEESVPFFTSGNDIGSRNVIYCEKSEISELVEVEKVDDSEGEDDVKDGYYLRLYFSTESNEIQSECRIIPKPIKQKKGGKKGKKNITTTEITTETSQTIVDYGYLSFSYHKLFVTALAANQNILKINPLRILVIGLGGGSLPLYLYNTFNTINLSVVELDPVVVNIAKKYFGLIENERCNVIIDNGLTFVNKEAETKENIYDIIMIDVDYKTRDNSLSFPPPEFLEDSFLINCKKLIGSENGMICINYGTHVADDLEKLVERLKPNFPDVLVFNSDDINKILCLFPKALSKSAKKLDALGYVERLTKSSKNQANIKRHDFGFAVNKAKWM